MANPIIKVKRFNSINGIPDYRTVDGELLYDRTERKLYIGDGDMLRISGNNPTPRIQFNENPYYQDIIVRQEFWNGTQSGYEGYRSGYRTWKSGFQEEWGTIKRESAISKSTTVTLEVSCILDYNIDFMKPHIIIGGVGVSDTVIASKGSSDPVSVLGTTTFNYRMRNMSTGASTSKNVYGYYYMCGYGYSGDDVPQPDLGGGDE